jgi:hypothetical protein
MTMIIANEYRIRMNEFVAKRETKRLVRKAARKAAKARAKAKRSK